VNATSYVVLDSGVLGSVINPSAAPEPEACKTWLKHLLVNGITVAIAEIVDEETRRELIRAAGHSRVTGATTQHPITV